MEETKADRVCRTKCWQIEFAGQSAGEEKAAEREFVSLLKEEVGLSDKSEE